MRDMLFVSHANPEDNEFARWLALQLAREGYPVWCDLTKLLGGEDFWKDIEQAIRERTMKFLFVLSRNSNQKPGTLNELQLAINVMRNQNLHDFIIPLLIDDMPSADFNVRLGTLNAMLFNQGWASGFRLLLEKLEQENVAKDPRFTPSAVSSWWREQFSAEEGLNDQPEEYLSNWFLINRLPGNIYFHTLFGTREIPFDLPYPALRHNQYLVSFADAQDFEGKLGQSLDIHDSIFFSLADFMERNNKLEKTVVDVNDRRNFVYRLLRMAWESKTRAMGLLPYDLANRNLCLYFPEGLVEDDKIHFENTNGERAYRWIVGYSPKRDRYWHFGIEAKPLVYPVLGYVIKSHVLFSDDGKNIWAKKSRLHKARRSQCKNWWNAEWRDRILATMFWLANEKDQIELILGTTVRIEVSKFPLSFTSPISYEDPSKSVSSLDEGEDEDSDEVAYETESYPDDEDTQ